MAQIKYWAKTFAANNILPFTLLCDHSLNMKQNQKIELRNLLLEDYLDLKNASIEAYSGMGGDFWDEQQLSRLLSIFPEGQLCVTVDGKVVASALSIIVDYKKFGDNHTYEQIIGNYTFNTHDPDGDVLYGI